MRKLASMFLGLVFSISGLHHASGQISSSAASTNPYRNFIGSWSGTVPLNPTNMLNTLKVVISETQNGKSMRWDYVFGIAGEEGYTTDTKWITLDPARSRIVTNWNHQAKVKFHAVGLITFAQNGVGSFVAEDSESNRITVDLEQETLKYLWETKKDGKSYSAYSTFEFKRDGKQGNVSATVSNKE